MQASSASEQDIEAIRQQYGFDQPFLVQYWSWLSKAAQGDLSKSLMSGEQVTQMIMQSLPNTMLIVVLSLIMSLAIGVPLGILAASYARTKTDTAVSAAARSAWRCRISGWR